MSDVIKDAKQLLDGATPGPWEVDIDGLEVYSTVDGDAVAHAQTPSDADLIAAAPELAEALAEETWEYAVAFKSTNGLGYLDRSGKPQPWPLLAAWYLTKEIAQVALMNSEYRKETLCIVRRRVSPVEVIDE